MNDENSWLDRLLNSMPMRVGLIALTSLATAGVIPLLFFNNRYLAPVVLKVASLLILGVVPGLAARNLLRGNAFLLQLVVGWLAMLGGMFVVNPLTVGYIGFSLRNSSLFPFRWEELGQIALAGVATCLALWAWKPVPISQPKATQSTKSSKSTSRPVKIAPRPRPPKKSKSRPASVAVRKITPQKTTAQKADLTGFWKEQSARLGRSVGRVRPRIEKAVNKTQHWADGLLDDVRVRLNTIQGQGKAQVHLRNRAARPKPTRKVSQQVRLVGEEEYRCPYCLEIVLKNDPRGVKICPICHTHHHADCWAVTGTCQVPHQ